jgi:ethanolaminephosphotransferase
MFTLVNAYFLTYYDYYFGASSDSLPEYEPVPKWVWVACAFSHFMAHTLDGIDGKQARRTGSSGPLGELMDHGLDSWTTLFVPFCIYSLFGRADYSFEPLRVLFIFWAIFVTFYFSHWEKYNTGILYLPWSYDATQVALFFCYLLTFQYSHTYWNFYVNVAGTDISCGKLFEYLSHFGGFVCAVPLAVYNVIAVYRNKTGKQKSVSEALRPLVPLTALFAITTGWAVWSPSQIVDKDPRMFFLLVGTIFSNIACRLIVSQMSSTRCEVFNWLLFPLSLLVLGIFGVASIRQNEHQLLTLLTAFVTLAHVHYGICVVRQMCQHFKINCFSLVKRPGHPLYKKSN